MKKRSYFLVMGITLISVFFLLFITGCTIDMAENSKPKEQNSITGNLVAESPTESAETAEPAQEIEIIQEGEYVIENLSDCVLPKKVINSTCCLDTNNNSICDRDEVSDSCGDKICSKYEDECSCPKDCGRCEEKNFGFCRYGACEGTGIEGIDGSEIIRCTAKPKLVCCGDSVCDKNSESCSSCFQDCCTLENFKNPQKLNFANYPGIAENLPIVVGDYAPPEDVITSEEILTKVASENISVGNGMLASEITLGARDYIVVGSPCDNKAAAELFRKEIVRNNESCNIFNPTEGMIRIFMTSDRNIAIYVGGYSHVETERASKFLVNYKNLKPTGTIKKI